MSDFNNVYTDDNETQINKIVDFSKIPNSVLFDHFFKCIKKMYSASNNNVESYYSIINGMSSVQADIINIINEANYKQINDIITKINSVINLMIAKYHETNDISLLIVDLLTKLPEQSEKKSEIENKLSLLGELVYNYNKEMEKLENPKDQ